MAIIDENSCPVLQPCFSCFPPLLLLFPSFASLVSLDQKQVDPFQKKSKILESNYKYFQTIGYPLFRCLCPIIWIPIPSLNIILVNLCLQDKARIHPHLPQQLPSLLLWHVTFLLAKVAVWKHPRVTKNWFGCPFLTAQDWSGYVQFQICNALTFSVSIHSIQGLLKNCQRQCITMLGK